MSPTNPLSPAVPLGGGERAACPPGRRMVVAVGGSAASLENVRAAATLAGLLQASWHAVHVETPGSDGETSRNRAAEALGLAASLGATVATVPAADVVEGLASQVEDQAATDLVLRWTKASGWRRWLQAPIAERLARRCGQISLHLPPAAPEPKRETAATDRPRPAPPLPARSYLLAAGFVALTSLFIAPVWYITGARGVDLLFLLPVIAAAVRLGLAQGLFAALLSVLCYNFLFLRPVLEFKPTAPQNVVMLVVLLGIALYTGILSDRLRGRLRLSDRTAKENAAIVTFAQELARAGDWEATADVVCRTMAAMLEVRAVLLREKQGELTLVGAVPGPPTFGPVDQVALDWTWRTGAEAGRGTTQMAAADWQFHALATSLGTLALLGIARDDGAPPVPADRAVLLSTLVAQAALAHERLRLEDQALARVAHPAG